MMFESKILDLKWDNSLDNIQYIKEVYQNDILFELFFDSNQWLSEELAREICRLKSLLFSLSFVAFSRLCYQQLKIFLNIALILTRYMLVSQ